MSAQQLIAEHIDLWTSTIKAKNTQGRGSSKKRELYGIQKLRELILELAVRGNLVPQDLSDEPANELMLRVHNFLSNDSCRGKFETLKRDKSVFPPEDFHHSSPSGWVWRELQELAVFINGKAHEQYVSEKEKFVLVNSKFVSNSGNIRKHVTERLTPLEAGDIALVMSDVPNGRALARSYLVEKNGIYTLNQRICGLITSPEFNKQYLMIALNRHEYMLAYNDGKKQSNLKKVQVMSTPIPVPPLEEQHRIVAKVDELMALCDQLEQQTESSLDAHNLLVDTLLSTLTDAKGADELSDNWARLAEHFDTLITTDYAVEQLKQTILQLAIMGKLVPQDPTDELASELLKKIAAEKAQLVKDKKIKRPKALPEIEEDEKPFELPSGWEWSRLQDLSEYIQRGKGPKYADASKVRVVSQKCVQWDGFSLELARYVDDSSLDKYQEQRYLRNNDLLWNSTGTGTVGRINVIGGVEPQTLVADSHVTVIRTLLVNPAFASQYISSAGIQARMEPDNEDALVSGTTKQVELNTTTVIALPVPVPPSEEQARIVTKVDELMAICDQLKVNINTAQITQLQLADTLASSSVDLV